MVLGALLPMVVRPAFSSRTLGGFPLPAAFHLQCHAVHKVCMSEPRMAFPASLHCASITISFALQEALSLDRTSHNQLQADIFNRKTDELSEPQPPEVEEVGVALCITNRKQAIKMVPVKQGQACFACQFPRFVFSVAVPRAYAGCSFSRE